VGGTPARSTGRGRGVGPLSGEVVDHAPEAMSQHCVFDVLVRIINHLPICGSNATRGGSTEGHSRMFTPVSTNGAGTIYIETYVSSKREQGAGYGLRLAQRARQRLRQMQAEREGRARAENGLQIVQDLLRKAKQTFEYLEESPTCAGELRVSQWVSGNASWPRM
jgi:hypothetical protein